MSALFWALGATLVISIISFVGVLSLFVKRKILNRIIILLVGFSAGTLLGGAMIHLIPELLEEEMGSSIFLFVLAGFAVFFLLERLLHWHHHHRCGGKCEVHTFAYMNLLGDGMHNFIDGIIIAASFVADWRLGIATSIAVLAHEIPQEISDFAVLLHAGLSKAKALLYNFLSAVVAILGAIIGYILVEQIAGVTPYLLAITAGGFIYIAASDLVPEVNKESRIARSFVSFAFFLLGLGFMYVLKLIFE